VAIRRGFEGGLLSGLSEFIMMGMYAFAFYLGGIFYRDRGKSMSDIFRCILGLIMGISGFGSVLASVPDIGVGVAAGIRIFKILDGTTEEETESGKQLHPISESSPCTIEFRNVSFKYPSRELNVLDHISFQIPHGKKIALAGPSGCGIFILSKKKIFPKENQQLCSFC